MRHGLCAPGHGPAVLGLPRAGALLLSGRGPRHLTATGPPEHTGADSKVRSSPEGIPLAGLLASLEAAMVVMRRYLVVANQTLQRTELRDELRERIEAEPSSFYLLVPDTPAADYPDVPAAADVLQPGMTWWATEYRGPASNEEATAQARQRLDQMLAELVALGIRAEGDLGGAHPLEAMQKALADHQFDEIIVATLPRHLSRWLRTDLPHRAERRFGLPVTTIITRRWP